MKRLITILLSSILLFSLVGCLETETPPPTPPTPPDNTLEDNSGMVDSRYDLKTYLYPLWEGTTVYNETVWFTVDNVAPLLYTPDEILSVKSYDLTTIYTEGVDYVLDGGSLVLTDNSRIPFMSLNEYFPTTPTMIALPRQGKSVLIWKVSAIVIVLLKTKVVQQKLVIPPI